VFLKSLTLKGFKSFADATTLEFTPGVTVVVGPNGSGKSNVVDAVAWVLGAQGPRALRSGRMDDVIFAGSAARPPLGRAEVSLVIDNSAGLLDIGFVEVTLTRTLFRSGESEYAINGAPCRLLDVQELLSDTGVGRQQHVIVSQGQLEAVLNGRPEERRLMIEDAAGVLKYRKRREKACRRLEATEGNLLRLHDLLREVRRQLRPLERQAEAARRHQALVDELCGLRLHLAGRELAELGARAEQVAATRAELGSAQESAGAALARLDEEIATAERALATVAGPAWTGGAGGHPSDALLRYEALRERARGLVALLAERRRGVERERSAVVEQLVASGLEAEAARLTGELATIDAEREALARAAAGDDAGAGADASAAAAARGELTARRGSLGRAADEVARAEAGLQDLTRRLDRLAEEARRLGQVGAEARAAEASLQGAVEEAEARRAAAEAEEADAEAVRRAEEGAWHGSTARAEALALGLGRARAGAGAQELAGLEGVVGRLADLVEIDPGWELAFEAAIGEVAAAIVVEGDTAARRSLVALDELGVDAAVLPLPARPPGSGTPGPPPTVPGELVRRHVRSARADVEELLELLLVTAVAVDGPWPRALDVALDHPGLVVVTPRGDRFSSRGWRLRAAGTGALEEALGEAQARAAVAAGRVAEAGDRVESSRARAAEARHEEARLHRLRDDNARRAADAARALARAEAERQETAAEVGSLGVHLHRLRDRLGQERARVAELEAMLPGLERAAAVRAERIEREVRARSLEERRGYLRQRLEEVRERLRRHEAERDEAERLLVLLDARAAATERLGAMVAGRLAVLEGELGRLREERRRRAEWARAIAERLEVLRAERVAGERVLGALRERSQRAALDEAETGVRVEAAEEAVRRDFGCEPEAAVSAPCPALPAGTTAAGRTRDLERELRQMGPINPLALEEHAALLERVAFVEGELDDVKGARRELGKVIRAIDSEIVGIFSAAYADVAESFTALFATLFPGGRGRLRLTDPDNLLETGIEIEARPSGKSVRQLSLLSGGERALTSLAFLFAVFRSRPSPFYLLDEVEAALDDVNLHRFLRLVDEFRRDSQLLIVSHQKRTMEAADCLYGITMSPGGSSRAVSERVVARA
jgi:chromosome segregation protein